MTTKKHARFKKVSMIVVLSLLVFCAVSMIATKVVYDTIFERYDPETTAPPSTLSAVVEARETVTFLSAENRLTGYLYRAEQEPLDALVVLAPGYRACADEYLWQISELLDYGWSVFAFDPTGSCHSEGESLVGFPQELCDLQAALHFIEENECFGYADIVLLGHSRGGYAVCCAADAADNIAAVVTVSGINSAMEGVMSSSVEAVGPLAYGNYPFLWLYQTLLFGSDTVNAEAAQVLSEAEVPVLIVHGVHDTTVPTDKFSVLSHREEIMSQPVEVYICDDAGQDGHTNLLFDADGTANNALIQKIHTFCVAQL